MGLLIQPPTCSNDAIQKLSCTCVCFHCHDFPDFPGPDQDIVYSSKKPASRKGMIDTSVPNVNMPVSDMRRHQCRFLSLVTFIVAFCQFHILLRSLTSHNGRSSPPLLRPSRVVGLGWGLSSGRVWGAFFACGGGPIVSAEDELL